MNVMARKFRQIDEAFDWVVEAKTPEEIVKRLKDVAAGNQVIIPLFRLGVGAVKADWGMPAGMPDNIKLDRNIPAGMGTTTLTLEWRRCRQFFEPGTNMKNLPAWKVEMNWLQLIEGVHHKEADLITYIKDGELLKLYPEFEAVLPALGIKEYNVPVKKKAASKKKV